MIRQTTAVILSMAMLIIMPILLIVVYTITGPFFEAMAQDYAVYGGLNSGEIISFGGAVLLFAMGLIAIPTALYLFLTNAGRSRLTPQRRM